MSTTLTLRVKSHVSAAAFAKWFSIIDCFIYFSLAVSHANFTQPRHIQLSNFLRFAPRIIFNLSPESDTVYGSKFDILCRRFKIQNLVEGAQMRSVNVVDFDRLSLWIMFTEPIWSGGLDSGLIPQTRSWPFTQVPHSSCLSVIQYYIFQSGFDTVINDIAWCPRWTRQQL